MPSATPATPHDGAAPRAGRLTHEQAIALLDVVSHLVDSLRISSQGLGDPGELGADTRRTLTEPSQMAALVAAMEAVGVDAAVIYAYEQTGILVGDGDEDLWSADELKRWQDAVTAYHRKLAPVRA